MGTCILIGTFVICMFIGVPIAFSLGIASLLTMLYLDIPPLVVFQKICDGMDNSTMMAIPFFILAGQIMSDGGMARKMVDFANMLVGRIRGGLGMVNVVASMFFGGISGSSVADTSSIGSILIPMMRRRGYDADFAVNITITSSTQGIVIPPSHNAIIYALAAGGVAAGGAVSIADLFLAGVVPGVLIGLGLMIMCYIVAVRRGYPKGEAVPARLWFKTTKDATLGLLTAIIIIGGIVSGIFTATEASAIAVIYAFAVSHFVYREIPLTAFAATVMRSLKTIAVVMFLIGTSASFGWLVAYLRIPTMVTEMLVGLSDNPIVILILINILLLLLGMVMDMAPLILITTPILLPIAIKVGVDPVHFGIIMMLNLGIGLCTPPVGSTLFVGCAIGKLPIERVARTIWPFYLTMIIVLLIVTYIPAITMTLPNWLS